MKEINLLKIRQELLEKRVKLAGKVKMATFLLAVFYCLAVGGVFSFWLILKRQSDQVATKIELQKKKIGELAEVETRQTFLKQRLSALTPLLAKEAIDYQAVLTQFEASVPEGVAFERIELNQEGKLDFEGTAVHVVALADFLEKLLASEAESIKLSSISREANGSYSFSFSLNVKI